MKSAADECHALGMKFKIYNTMRELSNRCQEIWAMRSFGGTYVVPTNLNASAGTTIQHTYSPPLTTTPIHHH